MQDHLTETLKMLRGIDGQGMVDWLCDALEHRISLPVGMPGDDVSDTLGDIVARLKGESTLLMFQTAMEVLMSRYTAAGNKPILNTLHHIAYCDATDEGKEIALRLERVLGMKRCPPGEDIMKWTDKYDHGEKK